MSVEDRHVQTQILPENQPIRDVLDVGFVRNKGECSTSSTAARMLPSLSAGSHPRTRGLLQNDATR